MKSSYELAMGKDAAGRTHRFSKAALARATKGLVHAREVKRLKKEAERAARRCPEISPVGPANNERKQ